MQRAEFSVLFILTLDDQILMFDAVVPRDSHARDFCEGNRLCR